MLQMLYSIPIWSHSSNDCLISLIRCHPYTDNSEIYTSRCLHLTIQGSPLYIQPTDISKSIPAQMNLSLSFLQPPKRCSFCHVFTLIKIYHGLPWWHSGWESACQCRGHGFEPWSGKIPHTAEQLGPWATITEPERLEPVLRYKRGHDNERPAHRDE